MRIKHRVVCGFGVTLIGGVMLANAAAGACLVKPVLAPDGSTHNAHVIAPKGEVARYQALGFIPQQCDATLDQLKQSVGNICSMAANTPANVGAHLASSRGISLTELCASGRAGLAEMQASKKP